MAAGLDHTVLLLEDGTAVACGNNCHGQCDIPNLPEGKTYIQVAAGTGHTVLLRSDGTVVACGRNFEHQCNIPMQEDFETCTQVSAGDCCSLLLQSDGRAIHLGHGGPWLISYQDYDGSSVNAVELSLGSPIVGAQHHAFIRQDGAMSHRGVAGGYAVIRDRTGNAYTQVATSRDHDGVCLLCLRSDGAVVHRGSNAYGQCNVPELEDGVTYVQVSSSGAHTVLLRSDGLAVAFGRNSVGQCELPGLAQGVRYVHVAAGGSHTVLVRSDGTAVAVGNNSSHQCDLPLLLSSTPQTSVQPDLVIQLTIDPLSDFEADVMLRTLGATLLYQLHVDRGVVDLCRTSHLLTVRADVARLIRPKACRMHVLLPDGRFLDRAWSWGRLLREFEPTRSWFRLEEID